MVKGEVSSVSLRLAAPGRKHGPREPGGCPATPAADATPFQEPKARPTPRGRRLAGRAPGVTQGPAPPSVRLRPAGWPGGLVWSS